MTEPAAFARTIILKIVAPSVLKPPGTPPTNDMSVPPCEIDGASGHKLKTEPAKLDCWMVKSPVEGELSAMSPSTELIGVPSASIFTVMTAVSPIEMESREDCR